VRTRGEPRLADRRVRPARSQTGFRVGERAREFWPAERARRGRAGTMAAL